MPRRWLTPTGLTTFTFTICTPDPKSSLAMHSVLRAQPMGRRTVLTSVPMAVLLPIEAPLTTSFLAIPMGLGTCSYTTRRSDATTLLSVSRFGAFSGNNWCFAPAFTSDGRYILFQSWASDLVGFDFNQGNDVFAHAMFYAVLTSGELPTRGPTLGWPAAIGKAYHVQFLDDMRGTNWREANGTVTVVGERAYFTDLTPASMQRCYRVVAQ